MKDHFDVEWRFLIHSEIYTFGFDANTNTACAQDADKKNIFLKLFSKFSRQKCNSANVVETRPDKNAYLITSY